MNQLLQSFLDQSEDVEFNIRLLKGGCKNAKYVGFYPNFKGQLVAHCSSTKEGPDYFPKEEILADLASR